jgi:hypothetical protein
MELAGYGPRYGHVLRRMIVAGINLPALAVFFAVAPSYSGPRRITRIPAKCSIQSHLWIALASENTSDFLPETDTIGCPDAKVFA